MPRILIDLTHNESFDHIKGEIFDIDFVFEFVQYGDPFPSLTELKRYDLIIIGEIIPADNHHDHLFLENELLNIKRYVRNYGGRLLITSSSGGDFDYKRELGSLRALSSITGVKRFRWGELFNSLPKNYYLEPENLIFNSLSDHEIFDGVNKLLFADCTLLEATSSENTEELLLTNNKTHFRFFSNERVISAENLPVIISKTIEGNEKIGKVLTIGSTLFMTDHKIYGLNAFDNKKFFMNIINWLLI